MTTHRLSHYITSYRGRAVLGFVCVLGYITCNMVSPVVLGRFIDGLTDKTLASRDMWLLLLFFLGIACLGLVVAIGMRRLLLGLSTRVEYDIRRDIFAHLSRMDYAFFQRERTGDLMTRMSSDLGAVREMVGQGLLQGSRMLVGFPFAFAMMFYTNAQMTLTVLLLLPVVSLLFFVLIRLIRKYYDLSQDQFSAITNFCQETFSGIRTIKGFAMENRQRDRFRGMNEEYIRRNMTLTRIEEPVWPFMMFLYWVGAVILLLVGGRQIINGTLSLGAYIQVQQYFLFLQWPILALGWTINIFQRGRTSWARIQSILETQPGITDPEPAARVDKVLSGTLEYRDVSLRIADRTLLDQINLVVPEGQCLGITGPTGSGKTLLVSLMVRLMDPTTGTVTIGGTPVKSLSLESLRRQIGIAPQEPFLFSDTLANNIALGLDPVHDALEKHEGRVVWAADVARLSDDVLSFPSKFQTMLGERGVTLSGGQRQRTAIGRAIAKKPCILILDDVFSAVDTQTEARILQGLLPVLKGRTSILISHRISTLRHADRIIVMDDGKIVQDGTHESLCTAPGYYHELDEIQRLEARLEES